MAAHGPDEAHGKSGQSSQQSHRSGRFVGECHVRLGMRESSHNEKNETQERDGKKEADNTSNQADCCADQKFTHYSPVKSRWNCLR